MDMRLLIVLFPVLAAATWAGFNIIRIALRQLSRLGSR